MTTIQDLIERLQNDEGADRDLDAAIWDWHVCRTDYAPHYTASLDACRALQAEVLPGWKRTTTEQQSGGWLVLLEHEDVDEADWIEGESVFEERAWLLAILRAKQAEAGHG